ncbi:tetraacyldisaccharide 4'-kinase [Shewanella cyperi]|uniref:tetraacyldisaccharide 4'-kinase n=1 Tax=Shewanella cyperi TaxID=2814292 RepID=UPI001A93FFBE|nr:tetraacyldisaccharide 4'-kinase [Shewanella cyperi]QSX42119.1 tetraacyldisaccharide 4'-kinase [Shewanella cyperi]
MQQWIHAIWYENKPGKWLLAPLSLLFWLVSAIRRLLFRLGVKQTVILPVPVIVVGNITAGGSGKTPTVIHLIELLRREGYTPGVISRGYGADIKGVRAVLSGASASEVGDEPAMIVARTCVPMVVGRDRVAAAKALLNGCGVDVIICDDGLQHYRLGRDIELALIDGQRRLGNGWLLPAGPLRELPWRLQQVDFVLNNGGKPSAGEWAMTLEPGPLQSLMAGHAAPEPGQQVNAFAGIGNPQRFFDTLNGLGFILDKVQAFNDHQALTIADLAAFGDGLPLLMTEKDAIKCLGFAKDNWWYLPVTANFPIEFDRQLVAAVAKAAANKKGQRNGF